MLLKSADSGCVRKQAICDKKKQFAKAQTERGDDMNPKLSGKLGIPIEKY